MIQTVKEQRDIETNELVGYIINNNIFVPIDINNSYYKIIQDWAKSGNQITPAFTEQERLEYFKNKKKEEIKQAFIDALNNGFTCSNNIKINADIDDISKLKAGVDLATTLGQTSLDVRDYNNVVHNLSIDEVNNMLIELGINYQTLLQKKWNLEDTVNNAQTIDEVEAIIW